MRTAFFALEVMLSLRGSVHVSAIGARVTTKCAVLVVGPACGGSVCTGFSVGLREFTRSGFEAFPSDGDAGADGDTRIEIEHILIVHADAALGDGLTDGPRRVSSVDAIGGGTQI